MANSNQDIRTNKLNIYLIKEKYTDEDSITKIEDDENIGRVSLGDKGFFYFKKSSTHEPEWLETFFKSHEAIDKSNFFGSGTRAVLITKVKYKSKNRFFAIPFGTGRFLLKDNCQDERFGLITSLNILESNSIRAIDKSTLTTNPKSSREQIAKASEAVDFQIDFEKDLINSITGRSNDEEFGATVTGKEALSISAKVDLTNLDKFLKKVIETYHKKDYQQNFQWIDQIKEVKDQAMIDSLDLELIKKIKSEDESVWLAVPDIVDWSDFQGFKYSTRKNDDCFDELDVKTFIDESQIDKDFDMEDLLDCTITFWSASEERIIFKWNAYACFNAEIDFKKKKYFLSKSKWYEINSEFVKEVNKSFDAIKQINLNLPDYNHENEGKYNEEAAEKIGALCLDAKNLPYGGGHSKIEFCDLLTKDKTFIHVKKYGGSAVLSHLFSQGYVSAELFLMDEAFRSKVVDKLITPEFKDVVKKSRPNPPEYKIVYGIITKNKKKITVPFFSKVALKNNKRILEAYGYEVCLTKILNVKPEVKKSKKKS